MSKTFTCHELGGVCEEKFSGNTFMEVIQKGMQHMGIDEAHQKHMMSMSERTGENKDQWMQRMQAEFDARSEDHA